MTEERSCEEAFDAWCDEYGAAVTWDEEHMAFRAGYAEGYAAGVRTPTLPAASRDAVRDVICDNIFGPLALTTSPPSDGFRYNACEPLADAMLARFEIRERVGDRPPAEREEAEVPRYETT